MIVIDQRTDQTPAVNMALEEHCVKRLDPGESYLLIYVNRPSVIIGRHQNLFAEVDTRVADAGGIAVVRRLSGGGAVYHDPGTLNFAFIGDYDKRRFLNYAALLEPVIGALQDMRIPAAFSPPNRILVAGRKVSGNSMVTDMRRMMAHGTLLVSTDLATLRAVLSPQLPMLSTLGVRSQPSPVANLAEGLDPFAGVDDFRRRFIDGVTSRFGGRRTLRLAPTDWDDIHELADTKYRSWEWTFGRSPAFSLVLATEIGPVTLDVNRGRISGLRKAPDGPSEDRLAPLRDRWIGKPFDQIHTAV